MKRIALFLAAAAATLASCVKENTIAPEQTSDNLVTIKALATKTTLDGNAVVWEQDDEIAVVLEGVENAVNFGTDGEVNGASAKFVGTIAPETEYESAYAVYPATAYSVEGGFGKISHTLPETQTGVVTSGMILSSALLDAEQLKAGNATASFHNALALVKVVVPAGVREVSLKSSDDALAGTLTFNEPNVDGIMTRAENGTKRTVTLSTGSELAAGTHNLLVYPGIAHTLTLTMVGTDGAEYTSAVSEIRFNAGEYRTIDLTKIFKVATDDLHVVLPAGGTIEVPVMTTDAYEYEVSMSAGANAWVSYVLPTKGFHKETITFTVAENTTGADREANVTITWADSKTKTFTIQQNNVYMDFVTDVNGDPIQWEENFGVYTNEDDVTAVYTYKNVFTIELSDDFSKGTYKVKNIFVYNNAYSGNVAGTYYANYEDETFTIIKNDSGYPFSNNTVALTYNEGEKTFTASSPIPFGYKFDATYLMNGGFIKGYTAAVKVDEPGAGDDEDSSLAGTWNLIAGEMGTSTGFGDAPTSLVGKTMIISGSGENYTIDTIGDQGYSLNVTFDGNILSVSMYGSTLKFVYDSETKTLTQNGEFMNYMNPAIRNIVATKQGGSVTVDNIVGDTWVQSCTEKNMLPSLDAKVVINKIDDTHVSISNLFGNATISSAVFDSSAMTLTIPAGWTHPYTGPVALQEIVFNISNDFNTLTCATSPLSLDYMSVTGYKLAK